MNTRHGEVFLQKVSSVPEKLKIENVKSFIVGHSESGAHHVLESAVDYEVITDEEKKELYVRLFEPAKLVHKKTINRHHDLTINIGTYKIIRKQEYNPFLKVMTNIFD